MKSLIISIVVLLVLTTGCISRMITNSLVPNNTNEVPDNVLEYNKAVHTTSTNAILEVAKENDGKTPYKYIDRVNSRATKGGEVSALSQVARQMVGNKTRQELEPIVGEGVSWVRENAIPLLTGVTSMLGIGGGLGVRTIRRRGKLNAILMESAGDGTKQRAREAVKHTGLEKEIV